MSKILGPDGVPQNTRRTREEMKGPVVSHEVEQWGALVTWLRTKQYTPDMVRATILDYEEKECTGSESTSKQQD